MDEWVGEWAYNKNNKECGPKPFLSLLLTINFTTIVDDFLLLGIKTLRVLIGPGFNFSLN
jgi:hypothetical protein